VCIVLGHIALNIALIASTVPVWSGASIGFALGCLALAAGHVIPTVRTGNELLRESEERPRPTAGFVARMTLILTGNAAVFVVTGMLIRTTESDIQRHPERLVPLALVGLAGIGAAMAGRSLRAKPQTQRNAEDDLVAGDEESWAAACVDALQDAAPSSVVSSSEAGEDTLTGGALDKTSSPNAPAPSRTGSDYIDEIARLAELRDKGVLSNDEFEAKKRQLLGS